MLSRTAENLFWMARYIERAESTARLITMGQRMAVLPASGYRDEWRSVLRVTDSSGYVGEGPSPRRTSSASCCWTRTTPPRSSRLVRARANGKSVRTKLHPGDVGGAQPELAPVRGDAGGRGPERDSPP